MPLPISRDTVVPGKQIRLQTMPLVSTLRLAREPDSTAVFLDQCRGLSQACLRSDAQLSCTGDDFIVKNVEF
jgi:hypothetical protein